MTSSPRSRRTPHPAFAERDVAAIRAAIAERARSRPPGGRSVGSVASHDRMSRRMASASGVAILSLECRLAPEHPRPASVDDTVAALRWLHAAPGELGEPATAVGVMGDSAGGTLAALACLRLRHEDPAEMPGLKLLVYGNFDLTAALPSQADMPPGGGVDPRPQRRVGHHRGDPRGEREQRRERVLRDAERGPAIPMRKRTTSQDRPRPAAAAAGRERTGARAWRASADSYS